MAMPGMMPLVTIAVVSAATAQTPAPGNVSVSWPPGPRLECAWDPASQQLAVSWAPTVSPFPVPLPSDIYEVQISDSASAKASAIYTTSDTNLTLGLDLLLPKTTYHLSARGHAGWAFYSGHGMGAGTWGMVGPSTACATGGRGEAGSMASRATTSGGGRAPGRGPSAAAKTFAFESWRLSEYSTEVDYLLNHNGADAEGSSLLLTVLAQYEYLAGSTVLHDSWLGGSVADAVLTTYCIEALVPDAPGNDTTYGSLDFADYASCNNQQDKSMAVCSCAVPVDRQWGRLNLKHERDCHLTGTKLPCTLGSKDCTCTCTPEQTQTSDQYTGMVPVFAADDPANAPVGQWYSHPMASACSGSETLGATRPDGSRCTWKMRPDARVMRGWQLFASGLNATGLRCDFRNPDLGPNCTPFARQIRQNVGIMRGVHAAAPLQPWTCGSGTTLD